MDKKISNSLVIENTITFSRIRNTKCISYNLFVNEIVNGSKQEYLLANILNPKTESVLIESKVVDYNKDKKWALPKDTIGLSTKSVKVSVNGSELSTNNYTYDSKLKLIYIHIDLAETDFIEMEYKVDRIIYVHKTLNKCEYSVAPVFHKSYNMGQHSLL